MVYNESAGESSIGVHEETRTREQEAITVINNPEWKLSMHYTKIVNFSVQGWNLRKFYMHTYVLKFYWPLLFLRILYCMSAFGFPFSWYTLHHQMLLKLIFGRKFLLSSPNISIQTRCDCMDLFSPLPASTRLLYWNRDLMITIKLCDYDIERRKKLLADSVLLLTTNCYVIMHKKVMHIRVGWNWPARKCNSTYHRHNGDAYRSIRGRLPLVI